jgi:hypothetical protein
MEVNSSQRTIEQRLDIVEHEVAELRSLMTRATAPADWLEKVAGSVTDEAAFREVLELGRALRLADRPSEEGDDGP